MHECNYYPYHNIIIKSNILQYNLLINPIKLKVVLACINGCEKYDVLSIQITDIMMWKLIADHDIVKTPDILPYYLVYKLNHIVREKIIFVRNAIEFFNLRIFKTACKLFLQRKT